MAAPPDQVVSAVESLPLHHEQSQGERFLEDREPDGEGRDPDSAVAVQLIAKTISLTISPPGRNTEESAAPSLSRDTPNPGLEDIPHSSTPMLPTGAQLYLATMEEEWPGAPEPPSATAHRILLTSRCSSMLETRYKTSSQTELCSRPKQLLDMPNETSHALRTLSLSPYLHRARLRRIRALLPPLLTSPSRPSLLDLIRRSIFLSQTAFASRKLAHSLASIRLARQLAARPSAEALVERCILPPECLPSPDPAKGGALVVAPALVARKRAVERERVKDGLRAWVGSVWRGQVRQREEGVRRWEERAGIGRVWRLRRFWERVGRGEV
ncbi:hypothetical protein C8A03DRAFT_15373 [Achaetomium macrosporum]|uniref:Uncharacterized protein n=1 Tax=Achaetomium macrosporum TaxID=79813 RepID=A0AAN7CBU7_9PEZI|nr:hypothetical protein C8A03DRAFT_15373 [Achaetomium macrosporum]